MSYTPPSPLDVSWQGAAEYRGALGRLRASWQPSTEQHVFEPVFRDGLGAAGEPVLQWEQFVAPIGAVLGVAPQLRSIIRAADYVGAQYRLDASWDGADSYASPYSTIIATWSDNRYVGPVGVAAPDMDAPLVIQQLLVKGAGGFDGYASGQNHYALLDWQYAPPQWVLNASWVGKDEYTAPVASAVDGAWALPQEAKQVSLTGWDNMAVGHPSLKSMRAIIAPGGFDSQQFMGPRVINSAAPLRPTGFVATGFGANKIWNWRQYLGLTGFSSQRFGELYVIGGLKEVKPSGLPSPGIGAAKVINTRADQRALPQGIKPPDMPRPAVSPQILRAAGVLGTVMGSHVVQFPPRPAGWLSQAFGYPVVEFKTKTLAAKGFEAFETGYPSVRDRAQKVWPPSLSGVGVFGDVQVRLRTFKVQVPGFDAHEPSPWTVLRNLSRVLEVPGVNTLAMGAGEIRNKSPNLTPEGIDSQRFGVADVSGWLKRIAPKGVPAPFDAFPPPVVSQTPSFAPKGIAAPAVPEPTVWLRHRAFDIGGFTTLRMGSPVVDYRWRKVVLQDKGIAGADYGQARVEHSYRALAPRSWTHEAFGNGWLSFGRRTLEPRGIEPIEMSHHQIGGTRYIGPEGFEATRWGARIVPEAQEIFPKTFTGTYGWPTVGNFRRHVRPVGFATDTDYRDRWGVAEVWNLRQYIVQEENAESLLWPPKFSPWLKLENRNKTIGAIGYVATHYGRAQLDNKARLLAPSGIAAPKLPDYQKTGSVTHRVRPLALEGLEPPAMSRWAVVWNKAFPLRPAGLVATSFGTADVVNTRRYRNVQGFDAHGPGFPFVAYAIRELTFESRYGIAPPSIALPDVRLNTRYVDVPGMDGSVRGQSKLGLPIVVTHFNRITTRWTHQERAGQPTVRNLTPEVRPRNWLDAEFGEQHVRLQWRPVAPDGANMQLFGKARIADRKQRVEVSGFTSMRFGDKLTVRKYGLDPVVTQFIDLRNMAIGDDGIQFEADKGYGVEPPAPQIGLHNLLKGYVFPSSSGDRGDMLTMGRPEITANTIRVEPGYWDLLVGEPTVGLKIRTLAADGIGPLVVDATHSGSMGSWGLARLSHHTIYAVSEATEQARRNHGYVNATQFKFVNEGAVCGTPKVSTHNDTIRHYAAYHGGSGLQYFGTPKLHNLLQQITVKGWSGMRLGMVSIPGDQVVEVDDPLPGHVFGTASVGRPLYIGPQTIKPVGVYGLEVGKAFVSHFHRAIYPQGHSSEAMGNSLGNSQGINMPLGLHVGPPNLHQQVGFDAASYGEPWISHRVRELQAPGWESFLCEYDYKNFDKRMRVRRTGQSSAQWQVVGAAGFVGTEYGVPNVKPGTQYIRPDGNTANHRQGAQYAN